MIKRLILLMAAACVAVAAVPGLALADDHDGDVEGIYLSLGDSLAAGSLANAAGDTIYPSNKSYTDRLFSKVQGRFGDGITHEKLGCDGEKTTDMLTGAETKCAYATGTQLGDAMAILATGEVVLVTIDIGANDINRAARLCNFEPGCVGAAANDIVTNVVIIMTALRSTGYTGPIVGMNYYNPNVAASIGYFPGAPGPLAPDPAFAVLSDTLAVGFNAGLEWAFGLFGAHVADVYGTFASGDFGDDGGKWQKKGNGIPDNADAACRLTYMCPKGDAKANIHPTKKGYKVMAGAFWQIVRDLDLGAV